MTAGRVWAWLGVLAVAGLMGCAGPSNAIRLSSGAEYMCRHCNCVMPAGVNPEAACPACNCGKKARECRRG